MMGLRISGRREGPARVDASVKLYMLTSYLCCQLFLYRTFGEGNNGRAVFASRIACVLTRLLFVSDGRCD